jgi:hypothetical protein
MATSNKPAFARSSGNVGGVLVETEESRRKRSGPQLVEPWMLNDAWAHLRERGELTNTVLLKGLRIMRSSAVCAMFARIPGVQVASRRPITLRLANGAR